MLSVNSNELRALFIDANLMEEDEKLNPQDIPKKIQEMKAFIEEMKNVKSTLARLRRDASSNTTQVEELEEQLESKSIEVETLQNQINLQNDKIKNLEISNIQKEEQKREATKKAQDLQYQINELKRDLNESFTDQKSIQATSENSYAEKKKLQDEIVTHKERIRVLEGHLNDLQKKTERFRNETSKQHTNNMDGMSSTIDNLNQTISQLNQNIQQLNDEIVDHKNEISNLKKKITELEKTVVDLQTETGNLEKIAVEQTKSGWLSKKSPNEVLGQKFQKRWFVQKGVSLTYFKSNKDDLSKPLGTLFLDGSRITSFGDNESIKKFGQAFAIEIAFDNNTSAGGKNVLLFAANEKDHSEWMASLNQAKESSAGRLTRKKNSSG